jgi:cytochrome c-type biogenesis protein CcmH/NrfG
MILRSSKNPANSQEERDEHIKTSITRAREAIAVDVKDGESWYVLGNALLTSFMNSEDKEEDKHGLLEKALKAYAMAVHARTRC